MKSVLLSILVTLVGVGAIAESLDDKHGRDRDRGGRHERDRDHRPPPHHGYPPRPPNYGGGGGHNGYPPPRPPPYYGQQRDILYCGSRDYRPNVCSSYRVRYVRDVRIRAQYSHAPCFYGRTFGVAQNGVWVSNGCEGQFEVIGR